MNIVQGFNDLTEEFLFFDNALFVGRLIATLEANFAFLEVAGSNFDTQRDALFNPLPFLDSATKVAVVDVDAERFAAISLFAKTGGESLAGIDDGVAGVFLGSDGNDNDLLGRDTGREDQAVVVRVSHD